MIFTLGFFTTLLFGASFEDAQKAQEKGDYKKALTIYEDLAKKGDKIREIGTGSGYQTAVLCAIGAVVYSVERQNELFKKTSLLLPKLGIRAKHLSFGDGYKGLPNYAPFDGVIVTAGAPEIPKALMAQLEIGGKLVIPVGENSQIMTLIIRKGETQFEKHEFGDFKFVPLLEDKN